MATPRPGGLHRLWLLLPCELKLMILDLLDTRTLKRVCSCSHASNELATPLLYRRSARDGCYSIKWACTRRGPPDYVPFAIGTLRKSVQYLGDVNAIYRPQHAYSTVEIRPIHFAICGGQRELIEALLELGAEPDSMLRGDIWDLQMAMDDVDLDWFIRLETFTDDSSFPVIFPLGLAWASDRIDIAELLADYGASGRVGQQLFKGELRVSSILHCLSRNAATAGTRLRPWPHILDAFRNCIDDRGLSGKTVLHEAAESGDWSILEWALAVGADLEIVDGESHTPLVSAISVLRVTHYLTNRWHNIIKCIRILSRRGARANPAVGESALQAAIRFYSRTPEYGSQMANLIKFLVRNGADVNEGQHHALRSLCSYILDNARAKLPQCESAKALFKFLIEQKPDPAILDSTPGHRRSLLFYALFAARGQPNYIFRGLFKAGAKIRPNEVNGFFLAWLKCPHLHGQGPGKYDIWQHADAIDQATVNLAYLKAIERRKPNLYKLLSASPLRQDTQHQFVPRLLRRFRYDWIRSLLMEHTEWIEYLDKCDKSQLYLRIVRAFCFDPGYKDRTAAKHVNKLLACDVEDERLPTALEMLRKHNLGKESVMLTKALEKVKAAHSEAGPEKRRRDFVDGFEEGRADDGPR